MSTKRVRHHVNPLAIVKNVSFVGFGNGKEIIVDVGADHGEFVAGLLKKFGDEKNFVLFEIRAVRVAQLRERFKDYENVAVFDGDAGRNFKGVLLPCMQEDGAVIEEIYVNFPDPWFKDRHKKRRFLTEQFLKNVREWIAPEAMWIFQTDQKKLFDETLEILHGCGVEVEQFTSSPYGVRTKWEDAKMDGGNDIYRARFRVKSNE